MYKNVQYNGHYREIVSAFCAKMYEWHGKWNVRDEVLM